MALAITKSNSLNLDFNTISETLKEIPALQRHVFILKTFDNKPTKQICKDLKIDEKQFWSYIHNVRVKLMESIN